MEAPQWKHIPKDIRRWSLCWIILSLAFVCAFAAALHPAPPASQKDFLWQIGSQDKDNREFALAPGSYAKFQEDGFFVIGQSDPKVDWPYVHPGPNDAWAGQRPHTFSIIFGLRAVSAAGNCRFHVALLDTQSASPPVLDVKVNGKSYRQKLPSGAGDASISGRPELGAHYQFVLEFPSSQLKDGQNEIAILSVSGSWMLYDWLGLEAPSGMEMAPAPATVFVDAGAAPVLVERGGRLQQPVRCIIRHSGAPLPVRVSIDQAPPSERTLQPGKNVFELLIPAEDKEVMSTLVLEIGGRPFLTRNLALKPVRRLTAYILPHSHTDIGYTEIQTEIEDKQVHNLMQGIAYARQTASNPPGARFVWNIEVLWAADLYLRRLSDAQRTEFFDALKQGSIALNAMYLNELTGLCRPEELLRLFRFATQLADQAGMSVDSAMISDVPGYTWGLVPAMEHAGIRYFSTAPNYFDRIGDILLQWENKPFWWVGPDGRSQVLVWIPYKGYAMSHSFASLTADFVEQYQAQLDRMAYPYDIAYMRWSGRGDNAAPDVGICNFVRDWNAKYAWPRFVISSTGEAFRAFESKYGATLPRVAGDWTPYWEDGAASSALETAMNRSSSDRLAQAEALWAMLRPAGYPLSAFEEAWRNVLLYSEHTWGAWCSISEPFRRETLEQWSIKQGYAFTADIQSRDLLSRALALGPGALERDAIDLFNTCSWPRTELVVVPKYLSEGKDRATDNTGASLPTQRLRSGELVVLARDVPPFAAKRVRLAPGPPYTESRVTAQGSVLDNGLVKIRLDERSGGIVELRLAGLDANFADTSDGQALNEYLYFVGDNAAEVKRNGPVRIRVREPGPLVASLLIESDAPGCNRLWREIRLAAGQDYAEIINTLDKQRIVAADYRAKNGKESLNFGFPFAVPGGQVRLEVPFGVIRPDLDQIPSACKNWFTVGRWADVANEKFGITWITLDAPLVQVGDLTANLLNSQSDPEVWRKSVGPTQKLYSWAMNNHWGTNYRAFQEGPHVFRFLLRPHHGYDPLTASRLAIAASLPLLPAAARMPGAVATPRLSLSSPDVLVTALKPSDDGKAVIVRLWGGSGRDVQTQIVWKDPMPRSVWLSNASEKPLTRVAGPITVPAWGLVTLRAELR
jgi:alpha-mannosidase